MSYYDSKKTSVTCSVCGAEFSKYKCEISPTQKKFYCSKPCRRTGLLTKTPPEERFWDKVVKTESCWLWDASVDRKGYGKINHNGKPKSAHRLSYEIAYGPIPEGMFVCHKCDNPPCVRPDHLFIGTNKDNMADMKSKGRGRKPLNKHKKNAKHLSHNRAVTS